MDAPAVLRVTPLTDRTGWRAAGEITLPTRQIWEGVLERLADRDEDVCYLELSEVTFVDVAGASALAATVQRLPRRRRVVLDTPPATLQRMLCLFWPDLSAIEVVA
ncbi:STAS domain-containing protein [Streptomyces sp. ISL-22]|nr:STAS domain-containing protein [Streptomyces sp. ISL-24]MBT2438524.1 STAS domain-containing protein [Streptomyces sp. ISL-22]